MTLRARLAAAFLVVLLGPLVIGGALLVSALRSAPPADPRVQVAATCEHLRVTAQGWAITAGVRGDSYLVVPRDVPGPWALCGAQALPEASHRGLAARAEIRSGGELTGFVYAVAPLPLPVAAPARSGPATMLGVILIGLGLATALGWWLAGLATRPLAVLTHTVDRASLGDLATRSYLSGPDEAGRLGRGVDRLLTTLQETQLLSVTDPLTGLANLRSLRDWLRREAERATRFGRTLGVLVLDLDHFKAVNDRYGHRAGDTVLVEFAGRVRGVIREVDLAFRQGGEEFVILLPETDVAGSLTAARRIGEAVRAAPFSIVIRGRAEPILVTVTVSIGIAVFPRHGRTGSEVLDAADVALYHAKGIGRDTFVLAEPAASLMALTGGASGGTPSPRSHGAG